MKNLILAFLFVMAVSVPGFAADLDDLLPPRPEAPAADEAPAPRGSHVPGVPPGRGPGVSRDEERGEEGPKDRRPPDPELKERLAAVKAAEAKVHAVAPKLREGSQADRASARVEARRALGELFDVKLDLQEFELSRLEARAAELKEKIARRKLSREKAVEERLAKMGGEDDWE